MKRSVVLRDFEGVWRLDRDIHHADGLTGTFTGRALWRPAPGGLAYHETGRMVLGRGHSLAGERRYFWTGDLSVLFEDGRFFHTVPPLGGTTTHWCDPDQYDGCYDFSLWPAFIVTWRVRGPRKDYHMVTRYVREGDFADADVGVHG